MRRSRQTCSAGASSRPGRFQSWRLNFNQGAFYADLDSALNYQLNGWDVIETRTREHAQRLADTLALAPLEDDTIPANSPGFRGEAAARAAVPVTYARRWMRSSSEPPARSLRIRWYHLRLWTLRDIRTASPLDKRQGSNPARSIALA